MSENLDLSGAVDALKEMLSGEDGNRQLQNIISMFGDNSQQSTSSSAGIDMDTILKMQKVMSAMNSGDNGRQAAFLQTLAPLLRPERRSAVDNAVRFLSIGKAIKVFKEIEGA